MDALIDSKKVHPYFFRFDVSNFVRETPTKLKQTQRGEFVGLTRNLLMGDAVSSTA